MSAENFGLTPEILLSIAEKIVPFSEIKYKTQTQRLCDFMDKFDKEYRDDARKFLIAVDSMIIDFDYPAINQSLQPRVEESFIDLLIRDTAFCVYIQKLHKKIPNKIIKKWLDIS